MAGLRAFVAASGTQSAAAEKLGIGEMLLCRVLKGNRQQTATFERLIGIIDALPAAHIPLDDAYIVTDTVPERRDAYLPNLARDVARYISQAVDRQLPEPRKEKEQ